MLCFFYIACDVSITLAEQTSTIIKKIAVVLSGDVGFYSGGKKLLDNLSGYSVKTVCGISSVVLFCFPS
jgi:precorrin-6B methylase 1